MRCFSNLVGYYTQMFICLDLDVCVINVMCINGSKQILLSFKLAIQWIVEVVLSLSNALCAFLMISIAFYVLSVVFRLKLGGVTSRS